MRETSNVVQSKIRFISYILAYVNITHILPSILISPTKIFFSHIILKSIFRKHLGYLDLCNRPYHLKGIHTFPSLYWTTRKNERGCSFRNVPLGKTWMNTITFCVLIMFTADCLFFSVICLSRKIEIYIQSCRDNNIEMSDK